MVLMSGRGRHVKRVWMWQVENSGELRDADPLCVRLGRLTGTES